MAYKRYTDEYVQAAEVGPFNSNGDSSTLDIFLGFEKQDDELLFDNMLKYGFNNIKVKTESWCKVNLIENDYTAAKIQLIIEPNVKEISRDCTITFYNNDFDAIDSDAKIKVKQNAAYYPYRYFYVNEQGILQDNNFSFNTNTNITTNNVVNYIQNNYLFNFKLGKSNKTNFVNDSTLSQFSILGTIQKADSTIVNLSDILEIISEQLYNENREIFKLKFKTSNIIAPSKLFILFFFVSFFSCYYSYWCTC